MVLLGVVFIGTESPVISVLAMVFIVLCGALELMMIGMDFMALLLVLIFVGGLAVLFLFSLLLLRQ
jgi:NADH-quinone oxidoreductase subunit J